MSDAIDLSGAGDGGPPQANPDGLSFVTPEEAEAEVEAAEVPEEVAAHRHVEPFPRDCAYEALECLDAFRETFAKVLEGSKYLPHLAKIARAAHDDRSNILDELSRAHARGRCRSQDEIDADEEDEAEAAEVEAEEVE